MNEGSERESTLRSEICKAARRMYEAGFCPANSGNISARLGEDAYLITPSGVCKDDLTEDAIVKINGRCETLDGRGKASSEARVHIYCYTHRPDVMGVCHSHAPYATALACMDTKLDRYITPDQVYYLGAVPRCAYQFCGTQAVADSMAPYMQKYSALLLGSHGTVTVGDSVMDAFYRLEALEQFAKIYCITNALGGAREFTAAEADAMFDDIAESGMIHPGNVRF